MHSVHRVHSVHSVHRVHSMHSVHSMHGMRRVHSVHSMHVWSNLLSCGDLKQNLYGCFAATRSWSRLSTRSWRDGRAGWRLCHQQRQKRKHGRPAGKQTKPACCTSWTCCAGDGCLKPCSSSLDRWFYCHQEQYCSCYHADWIPYTVYYCKHCLVVSAIPHRLHLVSKSLCVRCQAVDKQLVASVARKLNMARQAALAALREADESQAQAVFHEQLTGFAQTCGSFLASATSR